MIRCLSTEQMHFLINFFLFLVHLFLTKVLIIVQNYFKQYSLQQKTLLINQFKKWNLFQPFIANSNKINDSQLKLSNKIQIKKIITNNYSLIFQYKIIQFNKVNNVMQLLLIIIIQQYQLCVIVRSKSLNLNKNSCNQFNFLVNIHMIIQLIFISGSYLQIIIWSIDQQNLWICSQKLVEHSNYINCLILNHNEDLIISGSRDHKIKFLGQTESMDMLVTIIDHQNYVIGLSLNEKQNRVISCGQTYLYQQQKNHNRIKNGMLYKRQQLSRMDLEYASSMIIYSHSNYIIKNEQNQQNYSKIKQIAVKSDFNDCCYFFAQQYVKSKCLLVNKNGKTVNLLRINQNGDFITQQSIQFGDQYIFGQMSENGKQLMTWDSNSKEIQIRKYQQL
ncbi:unnamed protein product [Paramecium octaurelia]|uniref:Transmembrane protein n=1 Tax=Paramecium octaurelia TaxID=43137 RepID=A0A8S1Y4L3_PAROT|nr:unnamed protein product [Paramecium octaurelia]